ncbi:pre-mRNA-splicing factor cwc22 [Datura stramonium]|uniref:Pre-mRNA-splicing factor cwc22 n=1 Tax=Datura stramonium TaxID=4076 RepID=A0ABS8RYK4_DATST|nr:pre-mRNA-splicing factor cwc22 [Datura stramonium]
MAALVVIVNTKLPQIGELQVVHELISLELVTLLPEKLTEDSVDVAVGFIKECGSMLQRQRLCMIDKVHQKNFETCFVQQYSMIHRLQTNKLSNVAKFLALACVIRVPRMLNEHLSDPSMQESFETIFPKDNPKNTRFAINFFTSIGLAWITETLREYLKNMPNLILQQDKTVSRSGESDGESDDHQRKKRRRS